MNAMKPLSSVEAFLCCREAGEKEKESRGTMGSGTREETREALVFSLFPSLPALSIFPLLLFLLGYPVGNLWGSGGPRGGGGGAVHRLWILSDLFLLG